MRHRTLGPDSRAVTLETSINVIFIQCKISFITSITALSDDVGLATAPLIAFPPRKCASCITIAPSAPIARMSWQAFRALGTSEAFQATTLSSNRTTLSDRSGRCTIARKTWFWMVWQKIHWSVIARKTSFTVDAGCMVGAILTHSSSTHFPPNAQAKVLLIDKLIVDAGLGMTMALKQKIGLLMLRSKGDQAIGYLLHTSRTCSLRPEFRCGTVVGCRGDSIDRNSFRKYYAHTRIAVRCRCCCPWFCTSRHGPNKSIVHRSAMIGSCKNFAVSINNWFVDECLYSNFVSTNISRAPMSMQSPIH